MIPLIFYATRKCCGTVTDMTFLNRLRRRPALVVFDLDETLWPYGIDLFIVKPPYRKSGAHVVDATGQRMDPFPNVEPILKRLHEHNILMAAASRTTFPDGAFSLISLYGWDKYLKLYEIYPGSKTTHFKSLANKTGIRLEDMLFFDNETRNIADVSQLGVTCVMVDSETGLTWKDLEEGFKAFENSVRPH